VCEEDLGPARPRGKGGQRSGCFYLSRPPAPKIAERLAERGLEPRQAHVSVKRGQGSGFITVGDDATGVAGLDPHPCLSAQAPPQLSPSEAGVAGLDQRRARGGPRICGERQVNMFDIIAV
jgi:hypothetical protein